VAVVAVLATALSACAPGAAQVNVSESFASHGIATVPFAGGAPVHPVSGKTVLALTDWQVASIQASMPAADGSWVGINARTLDSQLTSPLRDAFADPSIPAQATPSWLIGVWWAHAKSSRAKLARTAFPAPDETKLVSVPLYVLALFTADGFADFGRSSATATGGPKALALGAGPALALDVCGTINGILTGASEFLDGAGLVGTAIKGALSATEAALDTITGGFITLIKKIISIVNVILNVASLLTPWKVQMSAAPSSGLEVALNGADSQHVKVTAKLVGVVDQPPKEVASCLDLFGISNPTDQSGSAVTWTDYDGFQPLLVSPSMLIPGARQKELDKSNQATFDFITGSESIDTSQADRVTDATPYVNAGVQRADVAKVSAWIKNELGTLLGQTPGADTLQALAVSVADNIALIADPVSVSLPVPVSYWQPKDKPAAGSDNGQKSSGGGRKPLAPLPGCYAPGYVETLTGQLVVKHYKGPAPGAGPSGPSAQNACIYEFDDKTALAIEYPYAVPDPDGSLGLAYQQLLTDYAADCNVASGYLPTTTGITSYFIWSGHSLAGTFWIGQGNDPVRILPHLARLAGLC